MSQAKIPRGTRFATLDLMRGFAALAILLRHIEDSGEPIVLPRSYLAVDLFFVLSGFVLAHAYGHRMGLGMTPRKFVEARLVRLYPLYCLATVLGASVAFATGSAGFPGGLIDLGTGLLLLPSFAALPSWGAAFRFDEPAWTLFCEWTVNLFWILVLPWLTKSRLKQIVALFAAVLAGLVVWQDTIDFGSMWAGLPAGVARAAFGFFAGTLVFRLHSVRPAPPLPAPLVILLLLAVLAPKDLRYTGLYDLAAALVACPLLVWLGAGASAGTLCSAAGRRLGYLSYPIYVLQLPLIVALRAAAEFVGHPLDDTHTVAFYAIVLPWTLGAATFLALLYDEPVRHWLRQRLALSDPRLAAQSLP